jgi:hypothetical protein
LIDAHTLYFVAFSTLSETAQRFPANQRQDHPTKSSVVAYTSVSVVRDDLLHAANCAPQPLVVTPVPWESRETNHGVTQPRAYSSRFACFS